MWVYFLLALVLFVADDATATSQTSCILYRKSPDESRIPQKPHFVDVTKEVGIGTEKQCIINTAPNCLFDSWDPQLNRWDQGSFCMEETLTGGACVGDVNQDNFPDFLFPRLHEHPILYVNQKNGTFKDLTFEYFPHTERLGSNGCMFVDVNNDGFEDLYISTVGEKQFYFYMSINGSSFIEKSNEMGLANKKRGVGNQKTAGFSLDCGDIDNDGYLDIITTEWLPQLDVDSDKPKDNLHFRTNSRFFLNDIGKRFMDKTNAANLVPLTSAPRNSFLATMCNPISKQSLHSLMYALGEPFQKREKEHITRYRLKGVIYNFLHSKYIYGHMNYTRNSRNASQYRYFTIPYEAMGKTQNHKFVTVECILLGSDRLGTIDIYAGYH